MRRLSTGVLLVMLLCIGTRSSFALPRFALMTGTKCQSCHVNPTGGGMRNEYGTTFSSDKLPLEALQDSEFTFSGKLNDHIAIGGDHRGQFIYDNGSNTTSFQAMTTSIYGSIQINKKYSFYFKQDLVNSGYGPYGSGEGQLSGPEVFALAKVLPGGGYIKGGLFMPDYGWRLDDHTAYTRGGDLGFTNSTITQQGLIFLPNYKDIGLEIGSYLGGLFVNAGLFNGDGNQYTIHMSNKKAYAAKAEYMGSISELNFRVGVSAYGYNIMSMKGAHAGFGIGSFTLLGEVDWTNNYITGGSSADSLENPDGKTMAAHVEADFGVIQGVWIIASFDMFDPVQGVAKDEAKRITAGFEFFPFSFVELRPQYRMNIEDPSVNNDQLVIQSHLWF